MAYEDFRERYGPVALVTGASSGIGAGFAEVLATRGFDLVLSARRTELMEGLAARLKADHGTKSQIVECDLSEPNGPAKLIAATERIDIGLLVSNAGFSVKGHFDKLDTARMTEMLMVNCHAPLQLAHGFVPRLTARGKGGIIFTSSTEGLIGCPYSTAYAASKALVVSLAEGLWGELQGAGVDVQALCPGLTVSDEVIRSGTLPSYLNNAQSTLDCARNSLDNIAAGPSYIPSDHYRKMFADLVASPRKETLIGMAESMKAYIPKA
jgi:uncharacterized protein